MELKELRERIDREDEVILEAFLRRMQVSREIAEWKKEKGMPVADEAREREQSAAVREKTPEEMRPYAERLFETIREISREDQTRRILDSAKDAGGTR